MPKFIEGNLIPPDSQILTVSQFTAQIKEVLESQLSDCWIRGEISNFRRQSSGHCYFSLKDSNGVLAAVIFRRDTLGLNVELRDGLEIIAYGRVNVYKPRGIYQFIIRHLIEDGAGRLQIEFERLKNLLYKEGLFDLERKQPLPLTPRTIGFITSPTGAAIHDFISIMQRQKWGGRIVVFPAKVQGKGAVKDIISMLDTVSKMPEIELLVVGRGGGSLENLWPFNEEEVIRAMADCNIPIISAVGHEIDYTLSDFVADHRAETPSAAAELIISRFQDYKVRLSQAVDSLDNISINRIDRLNAYLELQKSRLEGVSPKQLIEQFYLRLDDILNRQQAFIKAYIIDGKNRIDKLITRLYAISPENRLQLAKLQYNSVQQRYYRNVHIIMDKLCEKLNQLSKRMIDFSPEQTLKRGFVLVRNTKGEIVSSKDGITKGNKLKTHFYDGDVDVTVD